MLNTPALEPAEPAIAGAPMSVSNQGGGSCANTTVSNVAVLSTAQVCDVTAIPARTVPVSPRLTVEPATSVQVAPSGDV